MNRQKRFCELLKFREDIRVRSQKFACSSSQRLHRHRFLIVHDYGDTLRLRRQTTTLKRLPKTREIVPFEVLEHFEGTVKPHFLFTSVNIHIHPSYYITLPVLMNSPKPISSKNSTCRVDLLKNSAFSKRCLIIFIRH